MNKIIAAAQFSAAAHAGQVRKWTGAPYITHPARVASRAILLPNADEDLVCAAWLHDTLEDCHVPDYELDDLFGPRVSSLVCWLTNASKGSGLPQTASLTRADRKNLDREKLAAAPIEAKQIKLLDRIDNLRELPCTAETAGFFQLYAEESKLLVPIIADGSPELACELLNVIGELEEKLRGVKYKTPDLLFTSSDLRNAAWAGWHAALGESDAAEMCRDVARQEEIVVEFARRNSRELREQLATAQKRIRELEQNEFDRNVAAKEEADHLKEQDQVP